MNKTSILRVTPMDRVERRAAGFAVMQEHDYPDLAEHKALHDRLRRRTADLETHADLITGRDLLQFLKNWWLEHIQGEDKKYAPCLKVPVPL